MRKTIGKTVEVVYLFSSFFMVFLLLYILYFSIQYWNHNYPLVPDFESKMFSIAMLIAIVTIIAQWIEGRTKAIIKSSNNLFKSKRREHDKKRS